MGRGGVWGHSWLWWIVVIAIALYVINNPSQAGAFVQSGFQKIGDAGESLVTFVQSATG